MRRSRRPSAAAGSISKAEAFIVRLSAPRRKKRAPTIRIPPRLLAHIRRRHRLGIAKQAVVEWNGAPVKKINKGFRRARSIAG